jgi:hypothetical protein
MNAASYSNNSDEDQTQQWKPLLPFIRDILNARATALS